MAESTDRTILEQHEFPVVQLSYICVVREQLRESATYLYEVACSIMYPAKTAHLMLRVSGQNTYRNSAAKDVTFTLSETGATTYVELLESEQLEVRVVSFGGSYSKAFYYAHSGKISEQNARYISSTIQKLEA